MRSKKDGENYIVLPMGERIPILLDRAETDRSLRKIAECLSGLQKELLLLCEKEPEIYGLIRDEVFDLAGEELNEGSWRNRS